MNNEDNAFTRNENKTCKIGTSNVINRDIIDKSKDTLVNNNCVQKNNGDNRNSWIQNAKQNMTQKDVYMNL